MSQFKTFSQCHSLWLALCASWCLSACGGDSNDPDVITRDDLKSPGGLQLIDQGNGTVELRWFTSNYEDDFEGYNIYGAAISAAEMSDLGLIAGEPIQLLDNNGDAIEGAKSILARFTYESSNENALPGAADNENPDTTETDELKFSAFPYHKLRTANSQPNLPTCKPNIANTAGSCVFLGSSKEETDADDITSVGELSFTFPPDNATSSADDLLTIGQNYCFFIFAVQDEGKEISQSSTNVACIVPKYKATISTALTDANPYVGPQGDDSNNGLEAFRASCASDSCSTWSMVARASQLNTTNFTNIAFSFESYGGDVSYFVSGNNAAILPLGYFANGFSDSNFIAQIDAATALDLQSPTATKNPGGYSIEGQSVPIYESHIYVLASGDQSVEDPTSFYYDWFYVSALDCDARPCSIEFDVLLSKNPDVRSR